MYKLASITQKLRLPALCAVCHQYHRQQSAICSKCQSLLTPIHASCHYCALPLPENTVAICGDCCKKLPAIDKTIAAYSFEGPLRRLLHQFKYQEALYLCQFFTEAILYALPQNMALPECLIPVPMHSKRLKQRGFNQSLLLTKKISRALQVPYDRHLCKKIIHTAPQATLDAKDRYKNLHQAFAAKASQYRHVAVIDDLYTTGSTANEIAKTLKKTGVQCVELWCCARAVKH